MKSFLLFLLLASLTLSSQNPFTPIAAPNLPTNNFVKNAIATDNANNIWIAVSGGGYKLARYDGANWINLTSIFLATPTSITCDFSGNTWIGTTTSGLAKYDGTSFQFYNTGNSGICSNTITSVEFINNKLYIGSSNGFSEFDGTTFINYNTSNSGLSSNSVFCFAGEGSQIWIGTFNGLELLNAGSISYIGGGDKINDIMVDVNGYKWLGTETDGLIYYDNTLFTSINTTIPDIIGGKILRKITSIGTSETHHPVIPLLTISDDYLLGFAEITSPYTYKSYQLPFFANENLLFSNLSSGQLIFATDKHIIHPNTPKTLVIKFDPSQYIQENQLTYISGLNTQFLDINQVKAACSPLAAIHGDMGKPLYEVPKGSNSHPLVLSSFWMGAYKNGVLHVAAEQTEHSRTADFWPGLINSSTGMTDSANSVYFNRVWKINRIDIENFKYHFLMGNVQNGSYTIPSDIASWPGNGTVPGEMLAPYFDFNNDNSYNPYDGDYPIIKGDQMIWWVFNDQLSNHTSSGGNPIGVQVQASAYAYNCDSLIGSDNILNYSTFYNYKIINKSGVQLDSAAIAVLVESDLGHYIDDRIGCDVTNNLAFTYNGDNYDDDDEFGNIGYHYNTPYFTLNVLGGPPAPANDGIDNDHDGCIDCTFPLDSSGNVIIAGPSIDDDITPERSGLGGFLYYNNTSDSQTGNPTPNGNGIEYYNFISGKWRNGNNLRYDGIVGTGQSFPLCDFILPGSSDPYGYGLGGNMQNPVAMPPWTETTGNFPPGDRRFMITIDKFFLPAGGSTDFDFAYVFTQDSIALANGTLYEKMVSDNKKIKVWFKNNNAPSCLDLTGIGIKENKNEIYLLVYPVPATNNITIDAGENNTIKALEIIDITGRKIMQLPVGKTLTQLDISSFSPGVYMVKLSTENGTAFRKFIKQ